MFVALLPRDKKTGYLWIGVKNRSESQFNIDEGIFRVTGNGVPLRVLGLADRAASVAKGQRLRSIGLALAAGARGYAAGSGGGQSNYSGSVQSNGSWANFNGTVRDPNAALAAQRAASEQTQREMATLNARGESANAELNGRALLAQTLDPGVTVTGDVVIELPKAIRGQPGEIEAAISIGGETVVVKFSEAQ